MLLRQARLSERQHTSLVKLLGVDAFLECGATMYVGFSSSFLTDRGSIFISKEFATNCATLGNHLRHTGTESHNSLDTGERFHGPPRRICSKLKMDHPDVPDDVRLVAVHAMNITAGQVLYRPS
jgi:hypothetical protein